MMGSAVHFSNGYLAASVISILIMVFAPLALGRLAQQRLGVRWRYFGYGALIFFLFQIISRVPLVTLLQQQFASQLRSSPTTQIGWGLFLALTAGLFEEIGRYIGYRWLMGKEEKTWEKGVMYGLGHGGIESMLLIGGLVLAQLIGLLLTPASAIDALPPEQRALAQQQLAAIAAQPDWLPLIGAWERIWTLSFHVAMSVVVLQAFRGGGLRWLLLAIVLHTALDSVAVLVPVLLPGTPTMWIIEGIATIVGIASLWAIFVLRPKLPDADSPIAA
jgi:uncharacterized membrane protein YhfC